MQRGLEILSNRTPEGPTPLKQHITAIHDEVQEMLPQLRQTGQSVSLIICTDGLPSDATDVDFVQELRRLEELPVSIVIRLCTDELEVVSFYNAL